MHKTKLRALTDTEINLIKAVIGGLTHSVYREARHESPVGRVIGTAQGVIQLDVALTQLNHDEQQEP